MSVTATNYFRKVHHETHVIHLKKMYVFSLNKVFVKFVVKIKDFNEKSYGIFAETSMQVLSKKVINDIFGVRCEIYSNQS